MKTRTALLYACGLVLVFLVVEVPCAPKSKVSARNWGPQSMMYLKGKYGRRHVADYDEDQLYKLDLSDWDLLAKGPQK